MEPTQGNRTLQLESLSGASSLIASYDPANDTLGGVDLKSPFWLAVQRANGLGARGQGAVVAVIDTMCDTTLPRLTPRVRNAQVAPVGAHGTAVALLISTIAPECLLDIYPVLDVNGRPDERLAVEGISKAASSDANVLNLSLGIPRPFDSSTVPTTVDGISEVFVDTNSWLAKICPHEPGCTLCPAVESAVNSGKMVFAAAGNFDGTVSCPASAIGAFGVGFQKDVRTVVELPGGGMLENAAGTAAPRQSVTADIMVLEQDGIRGTSFASPLYAAIGALGVSSGDLTAYIASTKCAMYGASYQSVNRLGFSTEDTINAEVSWFDAALSRLPHAHSVTDGKLQNRTNITDPALCWSCTFFALPTYINAGLSRCATGKISEAYDLLTVAVRLAPWNPDALANLGVVFECAGQVKDAIDCFESALKFRPNFSVYLQKLAKLKAI